MTAKAIVMGLAKDDEDYDDIAGTVHSDDGLIFFHVGDIRVSMSIDDLMDFLKSELMGE